MYSLRNLEKKYGFNVVLDSVSAEIPASGISVIMGPSGAGKSTLLRQLAFVEVPDRGSIQLSLHSRLFAWPLRERPWPLVTCVFQGLFLFPHLTLRGNIELPLRSRLGPERRSEIVGGLVELFSMREFVDRFPNEVSGGQAQRAALARALALQPSLLLIDEPHTGLDLRQQSVLNRHLLALRDSGVGLIVTSHALQFATLLADRIVTVQGGVVSVHENDAKEKLLRELSSDNLLSG